MRIDRELRRRSALKFSELLSSLLSEIWVPKGRVSLRNSPMSLRRTDPFARPAKPDLPTHGLNRINTRRGFVQHRATPHRTIIKDKKKHPTKYRRTLDELRFSASFYYRFLWFSIVMAYAACSYRWLTNYLLSRYLSSDKTSLKSATENV